MRKWIPYPADARGSVWVEIQNAIPTPGGTYKTPPVFATTGATKPSSSGTTIAAWCGLTAAGVGVGVVGTTTKLYRTADFSTFTDATRSIGGAYTNTATSWCFEMFGNTMLAANKVDATQYRDASGVGTFENLAGAPKAKILVVQSNIALAFNINDGADKPNAWASSDVGDYANWATGEAVTASLILHKPGPITAAIALGDDVIVFKQSSVYRMRYVGSPIYWTVELLRSGIGTRHQGHVVATDQGIVFMESMGGAWSFDGATFRNIATEFAGTFITSTADNGSVYWPGTNSVWWSWGSSKIYAYNLPYDAWGWLNSYTATVSGLANYKLVSGEPAARYAVLGSANEVFSQVNGAFLVDLNDNVPVVSGTAVWGTQPSGQYAFLKSGVFGQGFGSDTLFQRVFPVFHGRSITTSAAAVFKLDSSKYETPDLAQAGTAISDLNSATAEHRFDFQLTAKYADFKVKTDDDPFEISDFVVVQKRGGES